MRFTAYLSIISLLQEQINFFSNLILMLKSNAVYICKLLPFLWFYLNNKNL